MQIARKYRNKSTCICCELAWKHLRSLVNQTHCSIKFFHFIRSFICMRSWCNALHCAPPLLCSPYDVVQALPGCAVESGRTTVRPMSARRPSPASGACRHACGTIPSPLPLRGGLHSVIPTPISPWRNRFTTWAVFGDLA